MWQFQLNFNCLIILCRFISFKLSFRCCGKLMSSTSECYFMGRPEV
uniref:Uncharacterized protein n=1 Tax=Arundo donax TaxID=35708 RepID=A0A0A9FFX7_ARUDO